jgi:YesN/AraC family two-component response regulator
MKHSNILIVDDNESFCFSLKKILVGKGHTIDIALTGREALTKLKNKFFNLVILDIHLPDTDGLELIPHFKKIHPNTETIIMTGHPSFKNTMQAANKGISGYFTKPLNIKDVLVKIDGIMEKQHILGLKPDYFSKVFKQLVGISPKQYRHASLAGTKKRKKS